MQPQPVKMSPFAKFRQLDRQNSLPKWVLIATRVIEGKHFKVTSDANQTELDRYINNRPLEKNLN